MMGRTNAPIASQSSERVKMRQQGADNWESEDRELGKQKQMSPTETQRQSIRERMSRETVWQGPLDNYGSLMHS